MMRDYQEIDASLTDFTVRGKGVRIPDDADLLAIAAGRNAASLVMMRAELRVAASPRRLAFWIFVLLTLSSIGVYVTVSGVSPGVMIGLVIVVVALVLVLIAAASSVRTHGDRAEAWLSAIDFRLAQLSHPAPLAPPGSTVAPRP